MYVADLARMRDRVLRVGFRISDYEVSVHLLEIVRPIVRRLAQFVFYELLELDSHGMKDIDYERFGRCLVQTRRHQLSL